MIAALLLSATVAGAPRIRSVEIISSLTSLVVGVPGCQAGTLCTQQAAYSVSPANANVAALLSQARRPASEPTPRVSGIPCSQSSDALRNLRAYFAHPAWETDYYPHVWVTISFQDGTALRAYSATQAAYGLPWTITWNDAVYRSYSAAFSRAVAALLPDSDWNHKQLAGDKLELQPRLSRATCAPENS